jgi:hypothetical protein
MATELSTMRCMLIYLIIVTGAAAADQPPPLDLSALTYSNRPDACGAIAQVTAELATCDALACVFNPELHALPSCIRTRNTTGIGCTIAELAS